MAAEAQRVHLEDEAAFSNKRWQAKERFMWHRRRQWAGFVVLPWLLACGFNQVIVDDENVKAAWAEVQNQYKRRSDLVPQLVGTVKGAKNFEQETFVKVAEARAAAGQVKMDASAIDSPEQLRAIEQAQGKLGGALGRLMVVAERYPELKATAEFRDLQAQLEGTENRLTVARKRFIEAVATYNKGVQTWPSALGAKMRGKDVRPTFEGAPGSEAAPSVQF